MGEVMIELKSVSKFFKRKCVLNNISYSFEKGKIHGIIGRNGAGKTVLMKIICGFLRADSGEVIKKSEDIGLIIENPGYLTAFSGYNNLEFLAGLRKKIGKEDILKYLEIVGLSKVKNQKVSTYSLGMKQRLAIAQAIMEEQEIIILDEPMNGLDNQGVKEIRELLLALKEKNRTIILASHNREDIEVLCDKVIELDQGNIVSIKEKSDEHKG